MVELVHLILSKFCIIVQINIEVIVAHHDYLFYLNAFGFIGGTSTSGILPVTNPYTAGRLLIYC